MVITLNNNDNNDNDNNSDNNDYFINVSNCFSRAGCPLIIEDTYLKGNLKKVRVIEKLVYSPTSRKPTPKIYGLYCRLRQVFVYEDLDHSGSKFCPISKI